MGYLDDLVAYWKMDETSGNALDAHSGGRNLTDNNGVTSDTGKINNARSFDFDSSQFFSRANEAALQTGDIDFTFTGWVNLGLGGSGNPIILAKDDETDGRDYTLDVSSSIRWYVNGGGTNIVDSGVTITPGSWYFFVAWYEMADQKCRIQINNGSVSTSGGADAPPTGTGDFTIGARTYSSFEGYFKGLIDEVGFWKRLLTSDERTALYNSGAGLSYDDFGGDVIIPRFVHHMRQQRMA